MVNRLSVEIARNVAAPLARRIGTAIAAYLLAQGIPQDLAEQFLLALGVVAGLTIDIVSAYVANKKKV